VRTRLPSSWKGRGTQESAGEREQVTWVDRIDRRQMVRQIVRVRPKDLTWGYRTPQGLLYIGIGGQELKCTIG